MSDLQALIEQIKWARGRELDTQTLEQLRQPENLTVLLEMFRSHNYITRNDAWYGLVAFGKPIIPVMLQELKAQEGLRRSGAAEVLGMLRDPSVVPELLIALKDDEYTVRRHAAEALGFIGDPTAVPFLIEMLADRGEDSVFEQAVYGLAEIAAEHDVSDLHELLSSDNPTMRLAAAYALEDKAGEAGIQGFIDLVRFGISGDRSEYERAAECLSGIGKPTVPILIEILRDDDNEVIRRLAAQVLSTIGDPAALPAMITAMNDESVDVREDAITGLGAFGLDALPVLLETILSDEGNDSWCAYTALRWIGVPAVEGLFALLDQEDEKKSKLVASTIGYIQIDSKNQDVLDRLIKSLDDNRINVQKGAAEALSRIRTPEALAAVEEWRRNQQEQ